MRTAPADCDQAERDTPDAISTYRIDAPGTLADNNDRDNLDFP
jgi:hypothetical protein